MSYMIFGVIAQRTLMFIITAAALGNDGLRSLYIYVYIYLNCCT